MKKEALYITIEKYILDKIKSGEYKMGDLIPSERELTKLFKTSRGTVNKALFDLTNKGYIYRTPGRGSFVRSTISKDDISFHEIVSESLSSRDLRRVRVIETINDTNQRFFIVGPNDTLLNREVYERKIDLLNHEDETVGLSIVTVHHDILSELEIDDITLDNFSKTQLFDKNMNYNRRVVVTNNKKIDLSKRAKLNIAFDNFPIQMDVIIEKDDRILVIFEIFLQIPEFSFSF